MSFSNSSRLLKVQCHLVDGSKGSDYGHRTSSYEAVSSADSDFDTRPCLIWEIDRLQHRKLWK